MRLDYKLYAATKEKLTLQEAINAVPALHNNAVGLLYGPKACAFVTLNDDGIISFGPGENVERPYEARFFDADCELRWVATPEDTPADAGEWVGNAVLIWDNKGGITTEGWTGADEVPCVRTARQHYLLWGDDSEDATANGWQTRHEHRIGTMQVPKRLGTDGELGFYEYLADPDESGNLAVVAERLCL